MPAFQSQRRSSQVSVIKGFEIETPRIRTFVFERRAMLKEVTG